MEMTVGKSPDFKLTRGKEVLSHTAIVETWKAGQLENRDVIAHFSLVMLCKNIREIRNSVPHNTVNVTVATTANVTEVSFKFTDTSIVFIAIFRYLPELTKGQLDGITSFIREIFEFAN